MAPHHRRPGRPTWLLVAAVALVACAVLVASAAGFDPDTNSSHPRANQTSSRTYQLLPEPDLPATAITVHNAAVGRPIPPGYVGLSLEYSTIEPYAGSNPAKIDPVLVQLVRNLAPGQRPVLRIGGDSTDWAWWTVPHMHRPIGIRIVLGPHFGAVLGGLARSLDARLILGIDLEADSRRLAGVEATHLIQSVGARWVGALELGNEPELYGSWPWLVPHAGGQLLGQAAGSVTRTERGIMARPPDYGVTAYVEDYRRIAAGLSGAGLAGPALGGPKWIARLSEFVERESRLSVVTVHAYPLQGCYTPRGAATYPTIGHELSRAASEGLAARLAAAVRTAHSHGLPLRVDEINSVSCGGSRGVSNTFASALWALDTMFALARVGVDGVNVHTFQRARYELFRIERPDGRSAGVVDPVYYGLLLFTRAAPPGSRLLRVSGARGALRAWATRAKDGRIRVVVINDATSGSRLLRVRAPGGSGPGSYETLNAPGIRATSGISLGGVSFGRVTETGVLPPAGRVVVPPVRGAYALRVPAASAAMLTLPPAQQRGR